MAKSIDLYFDEPLAEMSFAGKILIRTVSNIVFAIFFVATIASLANPTLVWLGGLLALVLVDKFIHRSKPRKVLLHLPNSGRVNIADYCSPQTIESVVSAHGAWFLYKSSFGLVLLDSLVDSKEIKETLLRLDISPAEFEAKIKDYIKNSNIAESHQDVTLMINALFIEALNIAVKGGADYIGPGDLFAAIAKSDNKDVVKLFALFQAQAGDVERALIFGRFKRLTAFRSKPRSIGGFASQRLRGRAVNRAWTARPTPTLDLYATDYSYLAKEGSVGLLIGHKEEYERLLNVLTRRFRPNALLVGEPGIGKTALMAHVAYMISKDKVPAELFDKRIVSLDVNRLTAGADDAEIELRVQRVFNEIRRAGNIVLYVPDVHSLAEAAGGKKSGALDEIIPMILDNDFPLIATTLPQEFKAHIESNSSIAQAFEIIRVKELSTDDAVRVLVYGSFFLEREYGIAISYPAIKTAVHLAKKYFASKVLPASASDLLKEGLVYASRHGGTRLSSDDVVSVAEMRTNIPIKRAGADEAGQLLNLEELIHHDLVDQEAAVKAVARSLREYRSGLSRSGGPIGTFLFVGPTGVGKTELSKILAKTQFGSVDNMIRFDMSQYQDKQSIFQFIGSPDGKMTGLLTDQVMEKPYSLILLDEFEKAHPDLLNLFLGVFDDGRLTDNLGRVVSFENTIIIATSNAHSDFIKAQIESGQTIEDISVELKKKLTSFFRPELLNRFSSVVVFRELRPEDIKEITRRSVKSLSTALAASQSIEITFSEEAISKLAELGYDPVFGARPLREVISTQIKDPLSKLILGSGLNRGSAVRVDLVDDKIKVITG